MRGRYTDIYGTDALRAPTVAEWAAFAASCNLRDMDTHVCALPDVADQLGAGSLGGEVPPHQIRHSAEVAGQDGDRPPGSRLYRCQPQLAHELDCGHMGVDEHR